jgi:hypothetical protein
MRYQVLVEFAGNMKVVVDGKNEEDAIFNAEDMVVRNYLDFSPECSADGKILKVYKEEEDPFKSILHKEE